MTLQSIALFAQYNSAQPSAPSGAFTNSTNFNFNNNTFDFKYESAGGEKLTYRYTTTEGGSLQGLKCLLPNQSNGFFPSNAGGFALLTDSGEEIYPWSNGVTFSLLNIAAEKDTLNAYWKMSYNDASISYHYVFYVSGKTLVMCIHADTPNAAFLTFDRSDLTPNAVVVPVPYLPYMNVLLSNGYFTSLFLDWDKTNASGIYPLDNEFSSQSSNFSQIAYYIHDSQQGRSSVYETAYLTVSTNFDEVLPNIPNPVSTQKKISEDKIILDLWSNDFNTFKNNVEQCGDAGIKNLWTIVHTWQNGGYDNQYPNVLPASSDLGGDVGLFALRDKAYSYGYLFGLHENYVDFYTNAASWNSNRVALEPDGTSKKAWYNSFTGQQSYLWKPTEALAAANEWSPKINNQYNTNSSFFDVHSAANPAAFVDFDANSNGSKKLYTVLTNYRKIGQSATANHHGPVSGEGLYHFLYAGYFDDFEAQINTGKGNWGYFQGVRLPLFPNFKLQKMHALTAQHGVGYYERFFSNEDGSSDFSAVSKEQVLTYMATELAYGNCGFIPTPDRCANFLETANLEYQHLYPAQKRYAAAKPISILYHDNGALLTASEYIKKYPKSFADNQSINFMSQIRIEYDNQTVVCVNRHPSKAWSVSIGKTGDWCDFHATVNNKNTLYVGATTNNKYNLPPKNGFLVYAPNAVPNAVEPSPSPETHTVTVYPNPASKGQTIAIVTEKATSVVVIDVLGQKIMELQRGKEKFEWHTNLSIPTGLYFVQVIFEDGLRKNIALMID
ncbi:MAG: hypothetical protein RLZZ292_203 [Bacteroidota bacterium]